MTPRVFSFAFLLFSIHSTPLCAEEIWTQLNSTGSPLEQTQDVIKDRNKRSQELQSNPRAMTNDKQIQELTGGNEALHDDIYNAASDILAPLSKRAKDDPVAMEKILLDAQQNPEGFFNSLSEEEKKKIRDIAGQIPNLNKP